MTKNDMLADPAVVLTSKNPTLSQPKPLDILIEAIRRQTASKVAAKDDQQRYQPRSNRNRRRQSQQNQQQRQSQQQALNNSNQQMQNVNSMNGRNSSRNANNRNSRRNQTQELRKKFNEFQSARSSYLDPSGFNSPLQNFYGSPSWFLGSPYQNYYGVHQKLGVTNEHVSREINDYYNRNRQSNDKFQSKQIIRAGLERTLQEAFPEYILNLYLVGSSTNGIGDTPNAADICIIIRKRKAKPISESEEASSKTDEETPSEASAEKVTEPRTPEPEEKKQTSTPINSPKDEGEKIVVTIVGESPISSKSTKSSTNIKSYGEICGESDCANKSESTDFEDEMHSCEITSEVSLNDIENVLQGKGFAQNVQLIPAKVPVLKFKDTITNLNVTLNLNQEVSIRNSQLIRDYCKMDWRFAPLAMIFKRWAQENQICNAAEKTISNYSWTLMTVHYLQVCEPPVLPCLQKLNPRRYEQSRGDIFKAIKFWRRQPARSWQSQNNQNLRQLLKGLFRYYGYTFNYNQHVISVREGRVLDRSHFSRRGTVDGKPEQWIPTYWNSYLAIEEPFTKTNTASSVHDKDKFDRIIDLFRLSSSSLRGIRISLFNIIADDLYFPITY